MNCDFFIVSSHQQGFRMMTKASVAGRRLHVALGNPELMGEGGIHRGDGNVTLTQQLSNLAAH